MVPNPIAVGLALCDQVIVDKDTLKPSLIGIFQGMSVAEFPSVAQPFSVFSSMSGGNGQGDLLLRVVEASTLDEIYSRAWKVYFPNRLQVVNLNVRIQQCLFRQSVNHVVSLRADEELVAGRTFRVYRPGQQS